MTDNVNKDKTRWKLGSLVLCCISLQSSTEALAAEVRMSCQWVIFCNLRVSVYFGVANWALGFSPGLS